VCAHPRRGKGLSESLRWGWRVAGDLSVVVVVVVVVVVIVWLANVSGFIADSI
jgi:hypothetical protein